jgi:hypothetical protein
MEGFENRRAFRGFGEWRLLELKSLEKVEDDQVVL